MDLSVERWEALSSTERETLAQRLAGELPAGFAFKAVHCLPLGNGQRHIAFFELGEASFALIPGASVQLGYDADRVWEPNSDELESWQYTSEEYGISQTIQEHIAEVTRRARQVDLAPFLIETSSSELGWEAISLDDKEVQEILREHPSRTSVEVCRGHVSTRVRKGQNGEIVAERSPFHTHAELAAQLAASGFRFPTSDEWEYACGGALPTLFRWGDHAPCDRYPTDVSPAEAAWRRQWVLSAGKLERPAEGFTSDWDYHLRPNAFGLSIASNPYKFELVSEIGLTRGGDGGSAICGGAGFFMGWLTLATAYFEEFACQHDPTKSVAHGYTVGRRVLQL